MHILYFHQHFTTPRGAGGTRSYEMARAMLRHGHGVTMVCGSYGLGQTGLDGPFENGRRRGRVDGIDVIEFDLSYSNADGLLKRARTFLRYALGGTKVALREPYDLAVATTTPLTVGIPVLVARWLRGKRYVFEVRDLWPELPRAMGVIRNPLLLGMLGMLEWLAYRNADRCIALSPGIAKGIADKGVPAKHIAMIPNGCDLGIFAQPAAPWRPEALDPSRLLAIFTGTHGQANGLDAVVEAAVELQRRGRNDVAIALVGDGKLKSALQDRARSEQLENLFFHPPVDKIRLAGLMASADVGLQILANIPAFYYGTSPNKFFDYLAAGLPVLTNYPGWVADLVTTAGAGVAVPPDDPAAFADALERLADDRSELLVMGQAARTLAQGEFAREDLSARWVDWVARGQS